QGLSPSRRPRPAGGAAAVGGRRPAQPERADRVPPAQGAGRRRPGPAEGGTPSDGRQTMTTYDKSVPLRGDPAKAIEFAAVTLSTAGFRLDRRGDATLVAQGPGMY